MAPRCSSRRCSRSTQLSQRSASATRSSYWSSGSTRNNSARNPPHRHGQPVTLGSADDDCLPDDIDRADEPQTLHRDRHPRRCFDEQLPFEVDIDTGRVGGPSAGLAFTLAIIDVLSEGELTNGLSIVATGTIDRDGNVGPVGGIHQKTVAAEQAGADVFLVPLCCDNFVDRATPANRSIHRVITRKPCCMPMRCR